MDQLNTEYQSLIKSKEELEAEIKSLSEILESNMDVGMKGDLIDTEGYPRSDIDVYSVRHARHKIICLQNDHKDVMRQIEEKLYAVHEFARKTKSASTAEDNCSSAVRSKSELVGFLLVDQVATGGPAEQAGLKVGDIIKAFGSVSKKNFKGLKDIGSVVTHSKDNIVKLVIERGSEEYRLELTPHTWSGRGLLGCNVIEIKE